MKSTGAIMPASLSLSAWSAKEIATTPLVVVCTARPQRYQEYHDDKQDGIVTDPHDQPRQQPLSAPSAQRMAD
jgi:hypothetical protein